MCARLPCGARITITVSRSWPPIAMVLSRRSTARWLAIVRRSVERRRPSSSRARVAVARHGARVVEVGAGIPRGAGAMRCGNPDGGRLVASRNPWRPASTDIGVLQPTLFAVQVAPRGIVAFPVGHRTRGRGRPQHGGGRRPTSPGILDLAGGDACDMPPQRNCCAGYCRSRRNGVGVELPLAEARRLRGTHVDRIAGRGLERAAGERAVGRSSGPG